MSASNSNSSSNYLAATLSGVSSDARVLIAAWGKMDSGQSPGSEDTLVELANTNVGASPRLRMGNNASRHLQALANGATLGTVAPSTDTWFHGGVAFGPWDGGFRALRRWLNGSVSENNFSLTNVGSTLNFLRVFYSHEGSTRHFKGKMTKVAIWLAKTTTQEDTIISELQTKTPDACSILPNFYWPLTSDALAAIGGTNLTATGTITYNAGDEPSLSGGASSPKRRRLIVI